MPPSMLPPPSSDTYSNQIGRGGTESHVRLDDQGTLQETGTRRGGNIFSRAWSSITRGNAEHQAHHPLLLVCSNCEAVTELHDDEVYEAVRRKLRQADSGFLGAEIEVKGICGKCWRQAPDDRQEDSVVVHG